MAQHIPCRTPSENANTSVHLNLWAESTAFSVVVATLHVFIFRYRFGVDTQVETITGLYRYLDPAYLLNDFFVNSTVAYGGRSAYVQLVACFCRFLPVPYAALFLTWLSHIFIALATYHASLCLFQRSRKHAMIATAIVLSVNSTALSLSCILQARLLVPFLVALPGALFALGYALRGRAYACVAAACIGALAHPASLQAGLVGITACALVAAYAALRGPRANRDRNVRDLAHAVTGAFILVLITYVFWIRPYKNTLTADEITYIYAYFRAAGHLVPSLFGVRDWVLFVAFLGATVLLWRSRWLGDSYGRDQLARAAVCIGIVLVICVVGYAGVEIIPTRMVVVSSTYRLVFIIKWIGLILLGGYVASLFSASTTFDRKLVAGALYISSGVYQPAWALIGLLADFVRTKFEKPNLARLFSFFTAMILGTAIYVYRDSEEYHALLVYSLVCAWFLWVRRSVLRLAVPVACCVVLGMVFAYGRINPDTFIAGILRGHQPIITLADDKDETYRLGEYLRNNSPENAVIMVPPQGLRLRLTAERAVVVDFKAFPFNDDAIREWYARIVFCYGKPDVIDLTVSDQLDAAYALIDSAHLRRIRDGYGATHAILFRNTPAEYPVIFESERYKVVRIE